MRIQKICLDLQFPFVCPEVIALADGDILSPTLGVGLYEVLLQSQIFLPVDRTICSGYFFCPVRANRSRTVRTGIVPYDQFKGGSLSLAALRCGWPR